MMKALPVEINWHPGLPVFASESFLRSVGDDCGWLGGLDESGCLRCILPYTIIKKNIFRMVRFRVETIPVCDDFDLGEEKAFLNSAVEYFRSIGADFIIPASTNAIFRTYPDGADAAPYGSYIIDLTLPEEKLWKNIDRITRQNIRSAGKKGVTIHTGVDDLQVTYSLIRDTFSRSKLPFMSEVAFMKYVQGLRDNGLVMSVDFHGAPQSHVVFAFSDYCAYAVYAGNIPRQCPGANKLLYWEAIRHFKSLGVRRYDFVGARINPEKGSKQDSINSLKRHFGARLIQGYIWKYSLSPIKYRLYCIAARIRSGGDIVDAERHKLGSIQNGGAGGTGA